MSSEVANARIASAVSKALRSPGSNKAAKSAAGSALSQIKTPSKVSRSAAESAVSRVLHGSGTNKAAKMAAGSALTQPPNRRK